MRLRVTVILLTLALMTGGLVALHFLLSPARATEHRSRTVRTAAAKRAFRRLHPCPATGLRKGPCAGYVIDHVKPLACGGPDSPDNMQWQTIADAKAKDAVERRDCGK
jgi:hypothetical protein